MIFIVRGITWSADPGARVINCSFTGPGDSRAPTDAINHAASKGAVVVAAAGNGDTKDPRYPAAYPDVIAVAATYEEDRRASLSNFGSWVDVAAPGVGVLSTDPGLRSIQRHQHGAPPRLRPRWPPPRGAARRLLGAAYSALPWTWVPEAAIRTTVGAA